MEHPVPNVPSPKLQLHVSVPVPPDAVVEKLTGWPLNCGLGDPVGVVTVGSALTVTRTLLDALPPTESVAVTVAVNDPAAE